MFLLFWARFYSRYIKFMFSHKRFQHLWFQHIILRVVRWLQVGFSSINYFLFEQKSSVIKQTQHWMHVIISLYTSGWSATRSGSIWDEKKSNAKGFSLFIPLFNLPSANDIFGTCPLEIDIKLLFSIAMSWLLEECSFFFH